MAETKNTENQSKETKNDKGTNSNTIRRTVAGGLIGATVGYLVTPENRKKLIVNMNTDKLKNTGTSFGHAVKEKSQKALDSIKNSAGKMFDKKQNVTTEGYTNDDEQTEGNETSIDAGMKQKPEPSKNKSTNKEENNIHDRLDRLEELLTQLIKEKDGNDEAQESKIAS